MTRLTFRFSSADTAEGLEDWFEEEVRRVGDTAAVVRAALRTYRQHGGTVAAAGGDQAGGPCPGLAQEEKSEIARLVVVALRNAGLTVAQPQAAPESAEASGLAGARAAARSMLGRRSLPDDE